MQHYDGLTLTNLRVSFSFSRSDSSLGSTAMPPLAPPNGTFISAAFQVLREARL